MGLFGELSRSKQDVVLVLHIDIGEGNSRGALLLSSPYSEMIYATKGAEKIIHSAHGKNLALTLSSIRGILEDTVRFLGIEAHNGNHYRVQKIYVIFSAPYYLSHTAHIKFKNDKGFVVTPKLVGDLVRNYKTNDDNEVTSREENLIGESPVVLSERVVNIKVNGYDTVSPYGKEAETLEVGVFRTEVSKEIAEGVDREIKKHFRAPTISEPLSLAVYIALRNHVHFESDFLFVVVGNEITEVSLVRGSMLLESVSFPFGKHSLIRKLSRELKTPEDITLGRVSLHSQNQLNEIEKNKMNAALGTSALRFEPFFENAIISLSRGSMAPQSVYLVADPDIAPVFKTFIEIDNLAGQAFLSSGFSVNLINVELAKTLMKFGEHAFCDTLLCLEGLFAISTKLPLDEGK